MSEPVLRPELKNHLFAPGPKRVLALEGGGVLGVIELAFLEKIESVLRQRSKRPTLVLSDYFDLIGGTSTGAIIATGLALGMTARQVKELYFDFGPAIFNRPLFGIPYITPRFNVSGLKYKLQAILGQRQMQTEDLKTGLAIVTKRIDTGSVWVLTNNPKAAYWNDPDPGQTDEKYLGNKHYYIWEILRASTAAPYYFHPKHLHIAKGEPDGLFVDGGISPYNNPAMLMFMLAGIKGYGFDWKLSRDDLLLISVGTGWIRPRISLTEGKRMWSAELAGNTLRGLVWDGHINTMTILQWLSQPRLSWSINSEIGALENECMISDVSSTELLSFQHYDMVFDKGWLKENAHVDMSDFEVRQLNDFMNPYIMNTAYEVASKVARRQVVEMDFPEQFDPLIPTGSKIPQIS